MRARVRRIKAKLPYAMATKQIEKLLALARRDAHRRTCEAINSAFERAFAK